MPASSLCPARRSTYAVRAFATSRFFGHGSEASRARAKIGRGFRSRFGLIYSRARREHRRGETSSTQSVFTPVSGEVGYGGERT